MKFSPYDIPIPLVFAWYVSPGSPPPERGRQTRDGCVKSAVFLSSTVNIWKTVADTAKVTINN